MWGDVMWVMICLLVIIAGMEEMESEYEFEY